MQLSINQQIDLDLVIERYLDNKATDIKALVNGYLDTLEGSEREILITVFIYLQREIKSNREREIIEKHKANMYTLLSQNGILNNEEQKTTKQVNSDELTINNFTEYPTDTNKLERLKRYEDLTNIVESLSDKLELLEEFKNDQPDIQTSDYTKVKVKCSNNGYDYKRLSIISDIQETEQLISHYSSELQQEKTYLLGVFDKIPCNHTRKLYYLRYIQLKQWYQIAINLEKSFTWCTKQHSDYLKVLEIEPLNHD